MPWLNPAGTTPATGPALSAGTSEVHDKLTRASDTRRMTGAELSEILKAIGWPVSELVDRLQVRPDTVMQWLRGRRPIPDNLADWLYRLRDAQSQVPPLPDGWRPGQ